MNENSRYAVGIDVGTSMVRCVVGHVDESTGVPTVVGVGVAPNSGMRKGIVTNLTGPSEAIDKALGEAERMSGYEVNEALLSLNGAHIISTKSDGMVAVGAGDHMISDEDIARVEDVATVGKIPANRDVLQVVPYEFKLDGQDNIKDPVGMTGTRLEISANVVSALAPHVDNLRKASEMATVAPHGIEVAVLAAARAVLTESQLENGVAVIDFGASTTSLAVYEEGDLQYIGIVPVGGANITNDLAIGLQTDPEIAEIVKCKHAIATGHNDPSEISLKHEGQVLKFSSSEIDEVVDARLDDILDKVAAELKKSGYAGRLPSGIVLTGGGANLTKIVEYTKEKFSLATKVGKPSGFSGVAEQVETPEYATAVGLMFADIEAATAAHHRGHRSAKHASGAGVVAKGGGLIKSLFSKFKQ